MPFEKPRKVILSTQEVKPVSDRFCMISGQYLPKHELCYTAGVVDRENGRKGRWWLSPEVGEAISTGLEDCPFWIRAWLFDHGVIVDEPL